MVSILNQATIPNLKPRVDLKFLLLFWVTHGQPATWDISWHPEVPQIDSLDFPDL